MSGSTARARRTAAASTRSAERINLNDLTLDELDEVEALVEAGEVRGRTTAVAYVWRRRRNTAFTIDDAKALTLREVEVVDEDDEGGDRPDPSPGPS